MVYYPCFMTPEEFRDTYLTVQNGLGNDLQSLILLLGNLRELASRLNAQVEAVQANYTQLNQVVEQFINEQERQ